MSSGKVLVVEDEMDLRDIYEIIIGRAGYEVRTSVNGQQALKDVDTFKPDLILLDIIMPIMDGKGFLKEVKLEDYPLMKVVVCSNTSDSSLMNEMVELGADAVVKKADLDPKSLMTLVGKYVK